MEKRNVLVTGASTGIGLKITQVLDKEKYHVFAGARKPEDIERLSNLVGVTAVKLEVTNDQDITTVLKLVQEKGGLFALINNAGISGTATILDTPITTHQKLFNVNVFSQLELVQQFFDQLKEHQGRIINISSISAYTNSGSYTSTKKAVDAFTTQMRDEFKKFSIQAATVNPGFFDTEIFSTARQRNAEYRQQSEFYKEDYEEGMKRYDAMKNANLKDPIMVAEKVAELLEVDTMPLNNIVANRTEQTWVYEYLAHRVKHANEGLDQPWSKEELLALFEEHL